eukprot:CAMPEP_0113564898 /NCGR_PEP_ID=MMETSP0015_2-20120614/21879_1 /TAXON_ID=2838 /ORGANISM="Odontella" /LENGTH=271 /DNA_ID=CAMNT_0000467039 /DNA_START=166 /DNA_END=982 /DNA_ORIENTATION=- /assembly_acc=CAM_ASM_000160
MPAPRMVLAIQAANHPVDWSKIALLSKSVRPWHIEELVLEGFGDIMKFDGFQAALEKYERPIRDELARRNPDAILVSSKGLGILSFLASQGLWDGPAVLLSPIPNACNHIQGGSWESEWSSTLKILESEGVGPLAFGVGTSHDEKMLIIDEMEATGICGRVRSSTNTFEKCSKWFLYSFPGNHGWKNDPSNARNIALLIDVLFYMHDQVANLPSARDQLYALPIDARMNNIPHSLEKEEYIPNIRFSDLSKEGARVAGLQVEQDIGQARLS